MQHAYCARHGGGRRVAEPLQEVAHQREVEVGREAEANVVVELLEVPLQGLAGLHYALL